MNGMKVTCIHPQASIVDETEKSHAPEIQDMDAPVVRTMIIAGTSHQKSKIENQSRSRDHKRSCTDTIMDDDHELYYKALCQ